MLIWTALVIAPRIHTGLPVVIPSRTRSTAIPARITASVDGIVVISEITASCMSFTALVVLIPKVSYGTRAAVCYATIKIGVIMRAWAAAILPDIDTFT